MKSLCVAVVVLSLISVCRSASLACEKLLKPVDKGPDLSGKWYVISYTSDYCLVPTLLYALIWPSIEVDFTPKDTPNVYNANTKIKMYGLCTTDSDDYFYGNNSLFDVDINDAPDGTPDILLQSGCPDCIVLKGDDISTTINNLILLSRRKTVTADELKEFETQADCMGYPEPKVMNTDHDYENCKSMDDDDIDTEALSARIYERLTKTYTEPLNCIIKTICDFLQKWWNGLW